MHEAMIYKPENEDRVMEFVITVEVVGVAKPMLKALRGAVASAVNAFPYLRFCGMRSTVVPDVFALADPDNQPDDFK